MRDFRDADADAGAEQSFLSLLADAQSADKAADILRTLLSGEK